MLNYKKPAFWIAAVAIAACIVAGVWFLINPAEAENGGAPVSDWLTGDSAVLKYVMDNYQINGQSITLGTYLESGGSGVKNYCYKTYSVFTEDGGPYLLTVNGVERVRHFFGKTRYGPEMKVTGIESSEDFGTPWVWTYTVRSEFISGGVWQKTGPNGGELSLTYEQIEQLTLFLNAVRMDEISLGPVGMLSRSVSLETYDGDYTLTFDEGIVALSFDDKVSARYPISEESLSLSWIIHNDALYKFLDALGQEGATQEAAEKQSYEISYFMKAPGRLTL